MIKKIQKIVYAIGFAMFAVPYVVFAKFGMEEVDVIMYNSDKTVAGVVNTIVKWLLGFVGALAVLMIVIAGIMYLTSGGDEGRVEKAKQWLIYAIIGLIVALLGWVIVSTIITNL